MGETDIEGRPVKVWQKEDRKDFKEFLFCVVGKRAMLLKTKPNAAETLCCFVVKKGIELSHRSGFKNLVGEKAGDGYIRNYCKRKGITVPWDVTPTSAIVPWEQKVMMDKLQANMIANLGAGNRTSGWTAANSPLGNSTAGNSALKSVEDKLATIEKKIEGLQYLNTIGNSALKSLEDKPTAMEKKIEGLQTPNIGSLDSILAKLEEKILAKLDQRLGSVEMKMAEVHKISSSVERLGNVVNLLVEKVGLNKEGA